MRKVLFVVIFIASLWAVSAIAATVKAIKATHLNDWQVAVSCTNGRTPSTQNVSGSIIVSCEGRQE